MEMATIGENKTNTQAGCIDGTNLKTDTMYENNGIYATDIEKAIKKAASDSFMFVQLIPTSYKTETGGGVRLQSATLIFKRV